MICRWLVFFLVAIPMGGAAIAQELPDTSEEPANAAAAPSTPARSPMSARPMLSPGEYIDLAAHLRRAYAKPPAQWPEPTLDAGVKHRELGKLPPVVFPPDRPQPTTEAKDLGEMLFLDPRLSGSEQIACASCHDPQLGWADGRAIAFGEKRRPLHRHSMTVLNAGLSESFFWDGRASSLEEQARAVILDPTEMRGSEKEIVERLTPVAEYRKAFAAVFGDETITLDRVVQAIATFERSIVSRRNAFDRFLDGDHQALSDTAVRGLHLFRTTARCLNCHNGPTLSDGQFHNLGLSFYGRSMEDLGRYYITQRPEDVGAFKTPTLRNLTRTAPYMHNGLFELDGVLRLYNAGMPTLRRTAAQKDDPLFPTKDKLLQPLALNQQDLADLRAFLESLTETALRLRSPLLPGLHR